VIDYQLIKSWLEMVVSMCWKLFRVVEREKKWLEEAESGKKVI